MSNFRTIMNKPGFDPFCMLHQYTPVLELTADDGSTVRVCERCWQDEIRRLERIRLEKERKQAAWRAECERLEITLVNRVRALFLPSLDKPAPRPGGRRTLETMEQE